MRIELHRSSGLTHRVLSSSFLGLPYRILKIDHKKELLRSLWGKGSQDLPVQDVGSKVWLNLPVLTQTHHHAVGLYYTGLQNP